MRTLRLGIAVVAALAVSPAWAQPKSSAPAAYNWTGAYLGTHAGGGWGASCWNFTQAGLDHGCGDIGGAFGGAQLGYNWQTGNVVLGAEISGSLGKITGSFVPAVASQGTDRTTIENFYLATARVGYAWDRTLAYAKGGAAWVHYDYARTCNGVTSTGVCAPIGATSTQGSEWRLGWTVGAGVEYGLLPNVSLALEYNYVGLGSRDGNFRGLPGYSCGAGAGQPCASDVKNDLSIVTARLNWRFGGP